MTVCWQTLLCYTRFRFHRQPHVMNSGASIVDGELTIPRRYISGLWYSQRRVHDEIYIYTYIKLHYARNQLVCITQRRPASPFTGGSIQICRLMICQARIALILATWKPVQVCVIRIRRACIHIYINEARIRWYRKSARFRSYNLRVSSFFPCRCKVEEFRYYQIYKTILAIGLTFISMYTIDLLFRETLSFGFY